MKKLALTSIGVAIALVAFMTILYCLPCNENACGDRDRCEMKDGGGKCHGEEDGCAMGDMKCKNEKGCEGKEMRCEKEWKDADGKCHKEVKVMIGGAHGMMGEGCGMHGDMKMGHGECGMHGKMKMGEGGCGMKEKMQMGGGCSMMKMGGHGCCCCMMMMNHCGMGDSMEGDSVHVKVRGKL